MTTEDHSVYPGTIRRTVIEYNGNLFIYTSGAGENNFNNIGTPSTIDKVLPTIIPIRSLIEDTTALSNDILGPMAFQRLDQQAFQYVQSVRNSQNK